jgi:hypothetical protein
MRDALSILQQAFNLNTGSLSQGPSLGYFYDEKEHKKQM